MTRWVTGLIAAACVSSLPLTVVALSPAEAPAAPTPPVPPIAPLASAEVATTEQSMTKKQISVKVNDDGKETSIEQNDSGITVIYPGKDGAKVEVKAKDLDALRETPEAYEVYRKYVPGAADWWPRVRVYTGRPGGPDGLLVIPPMPELAPLLEGKELSQADRERIEKELGTVRERVREGQKRALEGQQRALEGQKRAMESARKAMELQERRLAETKGQLSLAGKPRLGVEIGEVDDALKAHVGAGVLVRSVREGSPADKAGLESLDIIRSINGTAVTDPDELRKLVSDAQGELKLEVLRAGKPLSLTVPALEPAKEPSGDKVPPAAEEK